MTPFFKRNWSFLRPIWEDRDGDGLMRAVCSSKRREDPVSYLAVADRAAEMDLPKIERAFRLTAEFVSYKGKTVNQLPGTLRPAMLKVMKYLQHEAYWADANIVMCDVMKLWVSDKFWYLSLSDCYARTAHQAFKKIIGLGVWSTGYAKLNVRTEERTIHVHPLRIVSRLYWGNN